MMSEDSIHFPDSLKFKTHRLARTVYGGGGSCPIILCRLIRLSILNTIVSCVIKER